MTSKVITFPTAFSNKCVGVWITGYTSGSVDGKDSCGIHTLPTASGFTMNVESNWTHGYWLAIGN